MTTTTGGTVVLACGGYRSGSTLAYDVVGEYAERTGIGRRIGFVEPDQAAVLPTVWSFVEAMGTAVAKCHLAPGVDDASTAWDGLLDQGRVCPVYTVRDWRDVVHSWTRTFGQSVDEVFAHPRWALNVANLDAWVAREAHVLRYEDLVADPAWALDRVLCWAGLRRDPGAAAAAAAAAGASTTPSGTGAVDPRTLLHAGHVGDPSGGGWRGWTPAERDLVRHHVAPLMDRFGYAW